MLPNFLIIGAARCATGWISKNLNQHPNIFIPSKKELHFFDQNYDKGIAFYERYFDGRPEKAIGEATPAYLYFPKISSLIKKHIPEARLIVSLRNPVDRAFSHYLYLKSKAIKSDKDTFLSFEDKIQKTKRIIEEGRYYDMLTNYYDKFPKENILVLLYENMKQNPINFLQNIYSFLDVDSDFVSPIANYKLNASATKLGKAKSLFYFYLIFKKLKLYRLANAIDNFNKNEISEIDTETKHQLNTIYIEQTERLETFLDMDLSVWKE